MFFFLVNNSHFTNLVKFQLFVLSNASVFLIYFKIQEETLFHKKVEPLTKTSPEKNNSSVGKSVEKNQISSPSIRDSEKVGGSDLLIVCKKSLHIVNKCRC